MRISISSAILTEKRPSCASLFTLSLSPDNNLIRERRSPNVSRSMTVISVSTPSRRYLNRAYASSGSMCISDARVASAPERTISSIFDIRNPFLSLIISPICFLTSSIVCMLARNPLISSLDTSSAPALVSIENDRSAYLDHAFSSEDDDATATLTSNPFALSRSIACTVLSKAGERAATLIRLPTRENPAIFDSRASCSGISRSASMLIGIGTRSTYSIPCRSATICAISSSSFFRNSSSFLSCFSSSKLTVMVLLYRLLWPN